MYVKELSVHGGECVAMWFGPSSVCNPHVEKPGRLILQPVCGRSGCPFFFCPLSRMKSIFGCSAVD